jgi:hypothetical protein
MISGHAPPLKAREYGKGQIPSDLVVKCQAIDIIAVILSPIW